MKGSNTAEFPRISRWMREWFARYAARYVSRQFHGVRLLDRPPPVGAAPVIVYLNHSSWWDPLICLMLWRQFFAQRDAYAPMDAEAMQKYGFFKRLGFFPVRQQSMRGVIDFMRTGERILKKPNAMLWVTPQGRFADVREAPLFKAGLAELASHEPQVRCVPLAIEYTFWQERKPEVCASFGKEVALSSGATRVALNEQLEGALAETQERLAEAVVARDHSRFEVLAERAAGVGGVYDVWRRSRAAIRSEPFRPQHGVKP